MEIKTEIGLVPVEIKLIEPEELGALTFALAHTLECGELDKKTRNILEEILKTLEVD